MAARHGILPIRWAASLDGCSGTDFSKLELDATGLMIESNARRFPCLCVYVLQQLEQQLP
jgi:hypothetical protein